VTLYIGVAEDKRSGQCWVFLQWLQNMRSSSCSKNLTKQY